MTKETKKICPLCSGEKIIKGTCTCDMEWRGTRSGDDWDDCQCTPDNKCPACSGTGFVEEK